MGKIALDDFVRYAEEQFGYKVFVKKNNEPDSFVSIFGASFLNKPCYKRIE